MKNNKLFLQTLNGQVTDKIPFWYMRQAGRYLPEYMENRKTAGSFLDLCYAPDFAVEVTLQPLRRYQMDAAILFSDILVVPHALGQHLEFRQGEGPVLTPVDTADKINGLSMEGFHKHLAPVYETVTRLHKEIPETTTLIGFAGAPWTVATYMVAGHGSTDQAATRAMAYQDETAFQKLIDLLIVSTSEYLCRQIKQGAEVIQLFDTWAGNLPDDQFRKWAIAPVKKIVQNIRAIYPDTPIIGFPKGAGCRYPEYIRATGISAVSIDTTMPLKWVRDHIQPLCPVQGNLDPLLLVAGGEMMENRVKEILDCLGKGPFIFNLGHGIVPQTPPENVARVSEILRDYKR
ncbi:Uroporphyrinogen III decarboxylase [hydrothermal vent metagenome]|uniref:uroporphyrinogen decarboxylase n=1 Tax=hydrothermal vent metagenome TaxID=652676 RepID=A0A3B1AY19_9ZZZZ